MNRYPHFKEDFVGMAVLALGVEVFFGLISAAILFAKSAWFSTGTPSTTSEILCTSAKFGAVAAGFFFVIATYAIVYRTRNWKENPEEEA